MAKQFKWNIAAITEWHFFTGAIKKGKQLFPDFFQNAFSL